MKMAFWLLAAAIVYVYAGYPLLLLLVRRLAGERPIERADVERPATLIISAFNEEAVIAEKLQNSLALDYPAGRLEIIVVSDASVDQTDDIVRGFGPRGVVLVRMAQRGGKTVGLNAAVTQAKGEILVFSDANAMYAPDAVRKMVRNFADPMVGAVVGESNYSDPEVESARSEGLYWRYETALKRLESQTGSVVGGDGAIYAIRATSFVPMRADALSDFVNPLQIVQSGQRCVYEPEARSFEKAADDFGKEFRRKVRIVNRGWRAVMQMPELLNPLRYGLFAVKLASHKLLRWLVPALLVAALLLNCMLAGSGPVYLLSLASQLVFYGLAIAGFWLHEWPVLSRIVVIPYYFCLVNIASLLGIVDALRGRTYTTWTPPRAEQQ